MRIDAQKSREFQAAIFAVRSLDRTIQKMFRREVKRIGAPEWKQALAERAGSRVQHRMLVDTAVMTVSNQNVKLQSASKGRPLSGGLNPKTDYYTAEWGADHDRESTYTRRSPKGRSHKVTRHAARAVPRRNRKGWVFSPAVREMIPRFGRLFVQTTVRTIANALEGKQE